MNQIRLAQKRRSTSPLVLGCWMLDVGSRGLSQFVRKKHLQSLANSQYSFPFCEFSQFRRYFFLSQ